ncbi:MAG: metallophosphoesterase [Oscillospiraceae bacterium]|nr:metallophosphoesterase [Oscillospiraceae bacterium]
MKPVKTRRLVSLFVTLAMVAGMLTMPSLVYAAGDPCEAPVPVSVWKPILTDVLDGENVENLDDHGGVGIIRNSSTPNSYLTVVDGEIHFTPTRPTAQAEQINIAVGLTGGFEPKANTAYRIEFMASVEEGTDGPIETDPTIRMSFNNTDVASSDAILTETPVKQTHDWIQGTALSGNDGRVRITARSWAANSTTLIISDLEIFELEDCGVCDACTAEPDEPDEPAERYATRIYSMRDDTTLVAASGTDNLPDHNWLSSHNTGTVIVTAAPDATIAMNGRNGAGQTVRVKMQALAEAAVDADHDFEVVYSGTFSNNLTDIPRIRMEDGTLTNANSGSNINNGTAAVDGAFEHSIVLPFTDVMQNRPAGDFRAMSLSASTNGTDILFTDIEIFSLCPEGEECCKPEPTMNVIYDMQNDPTLSSISGLNTNSNRTGPGGIIGRNGNADMDIVVDNTTDPITLTIGPRGGTSQGVLFYLKEFLEVGKANHTYKIDYTGVFSAGAGNGRLRLDDGANPSAGTPRGMGTALDGTLRPATSNGLAFGQRDATTGEFSASFEAVFEDYVAMSNADNSRISFGNDGSADPIVVTGIVITAICPENCTDPGCKPSDSGGLSWTVNPPDASVSFTDDTPAGEAGTDIVGDYIDNVLVLSDLRFDPDNLPTSGGTLVVNYTKAHNSGRRIVAWTDLSGDEAEVERFAFATPANLEAGKTASSGGLATTATGGEITLPQELLYDSVTDTYATKIYMILTTNNDATHEPIRQRGGQPRNSGTSSLDVDREFELFRTVRLNVAEPATFARFVNMVPGVNETEMNFGWFTPIEDHDGDDSVLELLPAEELVGGRFWPETPSAALRVFTEPAGVGEMNQAYGYRTNKVVVDNLTPGDWAYRVGDGTTFNMPDIFTVYDPTGNKFELIMVADPQVGANSTDRDYWIDAMNRAVERQPNASFILSAGDNTGYANDFAEYETFFAVKQLRSIPYFTTVGNHDTVDQRRNATGATGPYEEDLSLLPMVFNWPNHTWLNNGDTLGTPRAVGTPGNQIRGGGNHYFSYGDTLFISLNSSFDLNNADINLPQYRAFMDEAIASHPDATWRIMTSHFDLFGNGSGHARSMPARQRNWATFISAYDIDFVVNGHDHTYSRSKFLEGTGPKTPSSWTTVPIGGAGLGWREIADQTPTKLDVDENNLFQASPGTYIAPKGTQYVTLGSPSDFKYFSIIPWMPWTAFDPVGYDPTPAMPNPTLDAGSRGNSYASRQQYSTLSVDGDTLTFNTYVIRRNGDEDLLDSITLRKEATLADLESIIADMEDVEKNNISDDTWDDFQDAIDAAKAATTAIEWLGCEGLGTNKAGQQCKGSDWRGCDDCFDVLNLFNPGRVTNNGHGSVGTADITTLRVAQAAGSDDIGALQANVDSLGLETGIAIGTAHITLLRVIQASGGGGGTGIHRAYMSLYASYYNLNPQTDKAALGVAIDRVTTLLANATEGKWEGQYEVGSKAVLQLVLDGAVFVHGIKLSTQAAIDKALSDLVAAEIVFLSKVSDIPCPWTELHEIKADEISTVDLIGWMSPTNDPKDEYFSWGDDNIRYDTMFTKRASDSSGGAEQDNAAMSGEEGGQRTDPAHGPANRAGGRGQSDGHITKTYNGNWVRYELDVEEAGMYEVKLGAVNPTGAAQRILLRSEGEKHFVDNGADNDPTVLTKNQKILAEFTVPGNYGGTTADFTDVSTLPATIAANNLVYLEEGKNVIELFFLNTGSLVVSTAMTPGADVDILTFELTDETIVIPEYPEDEDRVYLPLPGFHTGDSRHRQRGWRTDRGHMTLQQFRTATKLVVEIGSTGSAAPTFGSMQVQMANDSAGWLQTETTLLEAARTWNQAERTMTFDISKLTGGEHNKNTTGYGMFGISFYGLGWSELNVMNVWLEFDELPDPVVTKDVLFPWTSTGAPATGGLWDYDATDALPTLKTGVTFPNVAIVEKNNTWAADSDGGGILAFSGLDLSKFDFENEEIDDIYLDFGFTPSIGNSSRNISIWTDLSGPATEVNQLAFWTQANIDAKKIVQGAAGSSGNTFANLKGIPLDLLVDENGVTATTIYVTIDNQGGYALSNLRNVALVQISAMTLRLAVVIDPDDPGAGDWNRIYNLDDDLDSIAVGPITGADPATNSLINAGSLLEVTDNNPGAGKTKSLLVKPEDKGTYSNWMGVDIDNSVFNFKAGDRLKIVISGRSATATSLTLSTHKNETGGYAQMGILAEGGDVVVTGGEFEAVFIFTLTENRFEDLDALLRFKALTSGNSAALNDFYVDVLEIYEWEGED